VSVRVRRSVIYFTIYSFVGNGYFISPVFEKVNALTFKLKIHLAKGWRANERGGGGRGGGRERGGGRGQLS